MNERIPKCAGHTDRRKIKYPLAALGSSEAEGENQIERPADEIATNRRRPGRWGRKKHLRWHLVDLAPNTQRDERAERDQANAKAKAKAEPGTRPKDPGTRSRPGNEKKEAPALALGVDLAPDLERPSTKRRS